MQIYGQDIFVCTAVGFLTVYIWRRQRATTQRGGLKEIPGPKKDFLIGNLRIVPRSHWYEKFSAMAKPYGDAMSIDVLSFKLIVMNSLEAVEELFVKRANNYSNRAHDSMVNDQMGFGWILLQLQMGQAFNENRKVFRKALGPQSVSQYDLLIEQEAESFQKRFSGYSGDPFPVAEAAIGELLVKMVYGEKIFEERGQELIKVNAEGVTLVTWTFTQLWLIHILPIARFLPSWVPGISWHRFAADGRKKSDDLRFLGHSLVEKAMAEGTADFSITSEYLNEPEFTSDHLRDAAAMIYSGGVHTTGTLLSTLFSYLMAYPWVQMKVHRELDRVVGKGKTPNMTECLSLTYLHAALKEALRMDPPVPLGVPHVCKEDDIWNGYIIHKDTAIFPNIGGVMRNPKYWGNYGKLDRFEPERFLPECNPQANELPDVLSLAFGFGKRICPGRYLAVRNAQLFAAAVLSHYYIQQSVGRIPPNIIKFTGTEIRRPDNPRCMFVPRFQN